MNTIIQRQHIAKRRHFKRDDSSLPSNLGMKGFESRKASPSGSVQRQEAPFSLLLTAKPQAPSKTGHVAFKNMMRSLAKNLKSLPPRETTMGDIPPVTAAKSAKHAEIGPIASLSIAILAPLVLGLAFFLHAGKTFPVNIAEFALPDEEHAGFLSSLADIENAPIADDPLSELESVPALPISLSVREHVIAKGETLGSIAKLYGISQDSVISMNSITNVRRLSVGTTLKIPSMDGVAYSVKKGDSLSRIAKSFSVTPTAILDANNLETSTLSIGKSLFIPGAKLSSLERRRALGELFTWPVSGRMTSYFGWRSDPFSGARQFHNGLDIANDLGSRVNVAMEGKVAAVDYSAVYGNYIIIVHDDGFQTWYAHLNKTIVKAGQRVSQGQKIGEMGNSGFSTGSHLHFSIFKRGQALNPLKYLK